MARPDGSYRGQVVEVDPDPLSVEETARTFHTIRRSSAVWVAVITACASIVTTYLVTHAAPANCASAGDMNAAQKSISELNANVTALGQTIAKNADHAHNETAELGSRVDRNADKTDRELGRLSDKLEIFMRGK